MKHSHGEMDMVHVVSPAQLGDGFLVAHLQDEHGSARIIVDGDTCIRHGKDAYHSWKEFPDILKGIILENPDHFRDVHPEYDVIRQGRFLLSVSDPDGRTRQTRTCECAGMSADQLRDMLEAELEEGGS